MNLEGMRAFISNQTWFFAKTYAKFAPHEYMVREKVIGTDELFVEAVNYIRKNGIRMLYYKTERKYLFLDGYFYWVMSDNIDENKIINRCKPDDYDIVFMQKGTMAKK